MDERDDRGEHRQVEHDQHGERRTERTKPERVEMLRQRPVQERNVGVEACPVREPPRNVELLSEVNQQIGPLAPGHRHERGADGQQQHGIDPPRDLDDA